jgi:hypothetical protein
MTKTEIIAPPRVYYSNELLVNKISDLSQALNSFTSNKDTFIEGINQLSMLLSRYETSLSTTLQAIDKKGQDLSTYFIASYFDTKDIDQALWVYTMIRLLVRYVLLSDRFYEIGDKKYNLLARQVRRLIREMSVQGKDKCLSTKP